MDILNLLTIASLGTKSYVVNERIAFRANLVVQRRQFNSSHSTNHDQSGLALLAQAAYNMFVSSVPSLFDSSKMMTGFVVQVMLQFYGVMALIAEGA